VTMNTLILDCLPPITAENHTRETNFEFLERKNLKGRGKEIVVDAIQLEEYVELVDNDDELGLWEDVEARLDNYAFCIPQKKDEEFADKLHATFISGMKARINSETSIDRILVLKQQCATHDREFGYRFNSIAELRNVANERIRVLKSREVNNEWLRNEYRRKHPITTAIAMGEFQRVVVDGVTHIVRNIERKEVNVQKVYG